MNICVYCGEMISEGKGLLKHNMYICYKCLRSGKIEAEYNELKKKEFILKPKPYNATGLNTNFDKETDIIMLIDMSRKMAIFWSYNGKKMLSHGGTIETYSTTINSKEITFIFEKKFDKYGDYTRQYILNGKKVSKKYDIMDIIMKNIEQQKALNCELSQEQWEVERKMRILGKLFPNSKYTNNGEKDYITPMPRRFVSGNKKL